MSTFSADHRHPLTSVRPSSVNSRQRVDSGSGCIKRKRSDIAENAIKDGTFNARLVSGHESNLSFSPITTLLRAHLPLSWLHPNPGPHEIQGGSLLEATVDSVSRWEYQVLIARRIPNGLLYGLEKFESEIFVCFPLQNFVTETWVQQAVIGAAPQVGLPQLLEGQRNDLEEQDKRHARKNSSSLETASGAPRNKRGAAARLSILSPNEVQSIDTTASVDTPSIGDPGQFELREGTAMVQDAFSHGVTPTPIPSQAVPEQNLATAITEATSHEAPRLECPLPDLLAPDYLRQRYLDTLYLSKTSLAYYTKGPLSRARARARGAESTMSLTQLAAYYRGSIISPKKMDLKYRDTLPELVKSIPFHSESIAAEPSKKIKSKRKNLGKDGLWPMEAEFVTRWWRSHLSQGSCQSNDAEASLRNSMSQLRVRETEMQIILMLETLSLEARSEIMSESTKTIPTNPDVKVESIEHEESVSKPKTNKKERDLNSDLEMLADKLCIWHSVGLEAGSLPTENQRESEQSSSDTKDRLRTFCADVVIPFYSSKIPEVCKKLCRILGGPTLSPQHPKLPPTKQDTVSNLPPGTIIRDRNSLFNKRSLERVLSEEGLRQTFPPTLSRSNTFSSGSSFKREPSEASQRPVSRTGMHKSISFSNREIDLVADAKATAAKRRKLDIVANQKRELEAAIDALKKPNRSGAARTYMDDVESRMLQLPTKIGQGVQISATPKPKRQSTLDMDEYDLPAMPAFVNEQAKAIIPSSTIKPRGLDSVGSVRQSSGKKRAVLMAIHDTPSRGSARMTDSLSLNSRTSEQAAGFNQHSQFADKVVGTPAKLVQNNLQMEFDVSPLRMNKSMKPVKFQPVKKADLSMEQAFRDAPEIPEAAGKMMERVMRADDRQPDMSIYDSLGWNDDYEL